MRCLQTKNCIRIESRGRGPVGRGRMVRRREAGRRHRAGTSLTDSTSLRLVFAVRLAADNPTVEPSRLLETRPDRSATSSALGAEPSRSSLLGPPCLRRTPDPHLVGGFQIPLLTADPLDLGPHSNAERSGEAIDLLTTIQPVLIRSGTEATCSSLVCIAVVRPAGLGRKKERQLRALGGLLAPSLGRLMQLNSEPGRRLSRSSRSSYIARIE